MNDVVDPKYPHGHPFEDFWPEWSCGAYGYDWIADPFDRGSDPKLIPAGVVWIRREDCPEHA